MGTKVAKFGGTSLANAAQVRKALAIIQADPERRYVVVSAPGKRSGDDIKITDLLYQVLSERTGDYAPTLAVIKQRYAEIAEDLGVGLDLDSYFADIEDHLQNDPSPEFFASRGEYLNAQLIAACLGWTFVDAADVVRFSRRGRFLPDDTDAAMTEALRDIERAVIPGFYGATADGIIKTFPRGGSDVTGALVARTVDAAVYENWTDVSGILMADPRIVDNPPSIGRISYVALRELAYMGASVLHQDAINPVRYRGIPINIRNTDRPHDPGTWIVPDPTPDPAGPMIMGIAGKPGYAAVTVHKSQWVGTFGIGWALLRLFGDAKLIVDLALTGVDTWTMVVPSADLNPVLEDLLDDIERIFTPDTVHVRDDLTLVGVVESGTVPRGTVTARLADALVDAGITTHADAFTGDIHVLAIDTARYEDAVRAIYGALAGGRG